MYNSPGIGQESRLPGDTKGPKKVTYPRRRYRKWSIYGCFLKWCYPQNTPKWSFLVGKPMVVGYQHFKKHPYRSSESWQILLVPKSVVFQSISWCCEGVLLILDPPTWILPARQPYIRVLFSQTCGLRQTEFSFQFISGDDMVRNLWFSVGHIAVVVFVVVVVVAVVECLC